MAPQKQCMKHVSHVLCEGHGGLTACCKVQLQQMYAMLLHPVACADTWLNLVCMHNSCMQHGRLNRMSSTWRLNHKNMACNMAQPAMCCVKGAWLVAGMLQNVLHVTLYVQASAFHVHA
jgi:hypothetical protein